MMETLRRLTFKIYLGSTQRPCRLPIDVYEGETLQVNFDIRNPDGTGADLTGVTPEYKIARQGQSSAAQSYGTGSGVTIAGSIVTAEFEITDTLPRGDYVDQLRLAKAGDTVIATGGRFNVRPVIE